MAFAMDTLGYAKRLRNAGIPEPQAEAHAEAARDFVMAELVTKSDLIGVRQELQTVRQQLETSIETQTLRLTLRLGGIVAVGVSLLAVLLKLT